MKISQINGLILVGFLMNCVYANERKDMSEFDNVVNASNKIEQDIKKNQETHKKNADSFTKTVNDQINQDLDSQLKNLNDHLTDEYKQKMETQNAAIKRKGDELKKQAEAQAQKIKLEVDKTISSSH